MESARRESARFDIWKPVQILVIAAMAGFAFWQLSRVGFDWRLALEGASPWTFFLAMATLPVFGFPISACYIYAGLALDPWVGIGTCLAALCVNLSASYVLTRTLFRRPVERLIQRRGWKLPQLRETSQFRWVFALRTIPGPPFFFQNLAISLVGVPFFTYLWVSLMGQGAICIGVILSARAVSKNPGSVASWSILCIVIALLVAKLIRRFVTARKLPADRGISRKKT